MEISFELVGWRPNEVLELTDALTDADIGYRLEGTELSVSQADADRTDALIAELSDPDRDDDDGAGGASGPGAGEDDDEDEVGYALEDWTDDQIDDLKAALARHGVDHSWDEDGTLVVAARDEHEVDSLVAEVEGTLTEALRELSGPTREAIQDRSVLESPAFIDPATLVLAGHPRPEIRQLLQDLLYRADGVMPATVAGWCRELSALLPVPGSSADDGENSGDDHDELVYELIDWSPELRQQLVLVLEREAIPYEWDGDDIAVPAAHETEVDALIDQMEQGDELPPSTADDDEANYQLVSNLFVTADRLSHKPKDLALCGDFVDAAEQISEQPPGYQIADLEWRAIFELAAQVVQAIDEEEPDRVVGQRAGKLRDALRGFV